MRRFEAWLAEANTGLAVKEFPEGTRTATDAARAVGCEVGQIVKSLVFVAGGKAVVALVSGANRVDEKRFGAIAGDPLVKADAETARSATRYSIGGVPAFRDAGDGLPRRRHPEPSFGRAHDQAAELYPGELRRGKRRGDHTRGESREH